MSRTVYVIEEYDRETCQWFAVQTCLHRDHAERECAKWSKLPVHRVVAYGPSSEAKQKLCALHQEIDWMLGGVGGTDALTISAAILLRWRRTLADALDVALKEETPA